MREVGIDLSAARPTVLRSETTESADVVITMGCGDPCPVFPGKRYLDWPLNDPAGADLDTVRRIVTTSSRTGASGSTSCSTWSSRPMPAHLRPRRTGATAATRGVDGYAPISRTAITVSRMSMRMMNLWPTRSVPARQFVKAGAIEFPDYVFGQGA